MNSRIRRAAAIARDMYGVRGEVRPLPGEFDLNFRVTSPSADIVLKLSPESRLPVFDLVTACLYHLAAAKFPGSVPRLVAPSATGADASVSHVTFEGAPYVACAVTWLRGVPLAELRPRSPAVLEALGALLAELDAALADFDHPALDRDFAWRMESAPATIRAHLRHLDRGGDLVAATLDRATARLDPVVDGLPGAVIHNDGNDFNVLVRPSLGGARLIGLIDFGDVVRSWRAAEVAVAAAYAMMEMADPLDAVCAIARGYASVTPLTAEGVPRDPPDGGAQALPFRVGAGASDARTARQRVPGGEPGGGVATPWRAGPHGLAACGVQDPRGVRAGPQPRPRGGGFMDPGRPAAPVMSPELLARPNVLDLSVESPDLPHPDTAADPGAADAWIEREIATADATVAVGRYGEARLLYDTPAFQARGNDGPESRTVHLGLDFFAPPGSPVHAPLAPGQRVRPGEVIGWLGDASVNGGWPPHLHLQVMALDPLHDDGTPPEERGNFTGVVLHRLRAAWESRPDPTPLAGLPPGTPTSIASACSARLAEARSKRQSARRFWVRP